MADGSEQVDAQVWRWKQPNRRGHGSADHPAGAIQLGGRSLIMARASALAGTSIVMAATGTWTTVVSTIIICTSNTSSP